jgi:hypothetical protein
MANESTASSVSDSRSPLWGLVATYFPFLVISIVILFEYHAKGPPPPTFKNFQVVAALTGRTLLVHWLDEGRKDEKAEIAGIWSDPLREPKRVYEGRLRFLEGLKSSTLQVSTNTYVVGGANSGAAITTSIDVPANVKLQNGTDLSQLLLANGDAIVDPRESLFEDEIQVYLRAQTEASSNHRGLWSSPSTSRIYEEAASRMALESEKVIHWNFARARDLEFYVAIQLLLFGSIFFLVFATPRKTENHAAALQLTSLLFLLILPVLLGNLTPQLLSWTGGAMAGLVRRDRGIGAAGFYFWTAYLASLLYLAYLWAKAALTLVKNGPLGEWKILWTNNKTKRAIAAFFVGLWTIILLIGTLFVVLNAGHVSEAFFRSVAIGVCPSLVVPPGNTPVVDAASLAERVLILIWIALSATMIPKVEDSSSLSISQKRALLMGLASLVVFAIVVADSFTIVFLPANFIRQVAWSDRFWFALAGLFRQHYGDIHSLSPWVNILQGFEVHIGFFLSLVGLRSLFMFVKRS